MVKFQCPRCKKRGKKILMPYNALTKRFTCLNCGYVRQYKMDDDNQETSK